MSNWNTREGWDDCMRLKDNCPKCGEELHWNRIDQKFICFNHACLWQGSHADMLWELLRK